MKRNTLTIKELAQKIDRIHDKLENLPSNGQPETWLDGEEVIKKLHISKRTLQTYRDEGIIPFSQFRDKIYYKASDIQKHLEKHYKPAFKNV